MKYLVYSESLKPCGKKLKQISINGETFHVHGFEDSISVIMAILPKLIYKFNVIPIKISAGWYTLTICFSTIYGNAGYRRAKVS